MKTIDYDVYESEEGFLYYGKERQKTKSLSLAYMSSDFVGFVYEGDNVLNVPVVYKQHSNKLRTTQDFSPRMTDQHYVVARPIAVRFKDPTPEPEFVTLEKEDAWKLLISGDVEELEVYAHEKWRRVIWKHMFKFATDSGNWANSYEWYKALKWRRRVG